MQFQWPTPPLSFLTPLYLFLGLCSRYPEIAETKERKEIKWNQQKSRFRDYKTSKDQTNPILKANPYTMSACSGSAHVSREGGSQPGGEKG